MGKRGPPTGYVWSAAQRESRRLSALAKIEARNRRVLDCAVDEAVAVGWDKLTRKGVAERAQVAVGSVSHAYLNMNALRDEVMRAAILRKIPEIVAQGLAAGSEIARNAPPDLKRRALQTLT